MENEQSLEEFMGENWTNDDHHGDKEPISHQKIRESIKKGAPVEIEKLLEERDLLTLTVIDQSKIIENLKQDILASFSEKE